MQYKLHSILASAFLSLGIFSAQAQTVSDFEGQALSPESDFASTQQLDVAYSFQSGNVKFYGATNPWGSYSNFNFSNITDTTDQGFFEDRAAITGIGANNSNNYGLCYINIDYMGTDPTKTIPAGAALTGDAIGKKVSGFYVTNTTYAYYYMAAPAFANAQHWFKLTVRGYMNGQKTTDSVNFMLADFRNGQSINVNSWEWVNLTSLGNVDSLTFDLSSDDMDAGGMLTPSYFAMDNLTTMDDFCEPITDLIVQNITEDAAQISWSYMAADSFEFAIDESNSLAPTATTSYTNTGSFDATSLTVNTDYIFHIRRICSDTTHSDWDTVAFKTVDPNSISVVNNKLNIQISPNPASDYLDIQTGNKVDIRIFNALGQQIIQQDNASRINVSDIAPGIYILKATEIKSGESAAARFIKH